MNEINTIICGDNLQILQQMRKKVDLVYLDPPYDTGSNFEHLEINADGKYWEFMRPRILIIHELLSEKGSLYCHCDWNIAARFQGLLDEIFGNQNFIAKIIWQRSHASSYHRYLPHTYDTILFYGKSKNVKYFPQYLPYSDNETEEKYKYVETETGRRYRLVSIVKNVSERSISTFEFLGVTRTWRYSKEKMEDEFRQGRIVQSKPGAVPMQKRYADEGRLIGDIWTDISVINPKTKEKNGYPTQKPMALLERIIKMSTQEGDFVLDPFCGSGTTLVVAEQLNRKWIGIDISSTACQIANQRLSQQDLKTNSNNLIQFQDYRSLREIRDLPHYEFENWIIATLKKVVLENQKFARNKNLDLSSNPNFYSITKGFGFDMGFTGIDVSIPVMVKQKEKIDARDINGFAIQLNHYGRKKGLFIAFSFSKNALAEIKKKKLEGIDIIPIRAKELISEID